MKKRLLSLILCLNVAVLTLVGCDGRELADKEIVAEETKTTDIANETTEVEVKFNCRAFWVESISYSNNILHLYHADTPDSSVDFDLNYDIDEKCKWLIVNDYGEEEWLVDGNDSAAQEVIDKVTDAHTLYKKKCYLGAGLTEDAERRMHYDLILKGYSTSENSATITEVLMLHQDISSNYIEEEDDTFIAEY